MSAAIWTQTQGEVLVVYFSEAKILDDTRIQQVGKELLDVISRAEKSKMLLNFQNVVFMSSAMIGKLILVNKKCKEEKVDLKCCSITPNIKEVFKITNLTKVFDIHEDEASALKAFEKKGWFS